MYFSIGQLICHHYKNLHSGPIVVDRKMKPQKDGLTLFGQTGYPVFYLVSLFGQRGWLDNEFDLLSGGQITGANVI